MQLEWLLEAELGVGVRNGPSAPRGNTEEPRSKSDAEKNGGQFISWEYGPNKQDAFKQHSAKKPQGL